MPVFLCFILHLMLLLAYVLVRGVFLVWNWNFFRSQSISEILQAFFWGLRFDLSSTAILMAPLFIFSVGIYLFQLIYKKNRWGSWAILIVFLALQIPFLTVNFVDSEFVNFMGRRSTVDTLFLTREVPGKFWSLILSYAPLATIWLVATIAFIVASVQLTRWHEFRRAYRKSFLTAMAVVYFVLLMVSARGGLQNKPIGFAHAQIFTSPMMNNLLMNSSFTMIQTIKRQSLPRDVFFQDQREMLRWLSPVRKAEAKIRVPANKPNVVLIILESFNLEYVGAAQADKKGYTPFLDELSKKSLFFTNAFANARRSIEGIGAIMGGIPALMNEPFISSQYLTNYFLGIGTLLQQQGYQTHFFHGAKNGSMYFDQFMKSAGVKNYYGLNEYPNKEDYDGTWGIWDEPFLQWMALQLDHSKTPFFSTVFTLTSHHPFVVPPQYVGKFPKGDLDIHQAIGYTDYSVRKFFETAEKKPWFKETIFIITADHTYKSFRPEYDNELGAYRVPLMIYAPGQVLPQVDTQEIVQHTDILPTILDLVGAQSKERNHLGKTIFDPSDRFAVNYIDGRYLFVADKYVLKHHRGGNFEMYSLSDPGMKNPLSEPAEQKTKLENRLKATIQYFSQGLWDNKLYYPSGF